MTYILHTILIGADRYTEDKQALKEVGKWVG